MKPVWDELMDEFAGNPGVLVADVDCTAEGQELCEKVGVQGYPTLKHGDPEDLQDYEGGRDLDALTEFAASLGPSCNPEHLDLCAQEQRTQIQEYLKLGRGKLEGLVEAKEKELADAEETFKTGVEELQKQYEALEAAKKQKLADIKDSGLGLMMSVQKAKGKPEL